MGIKLTKIVLIGNPNVGKSTLFNTLTGRCQHVGNWPGKTVQKKEGIFKIGKRKIQIIDLPGCYSLNPHTDEEEVVVDYLNQLTSDTVVVQVVDGENLIRNLYLTLQLLDRKIPLILAVNMKHQHLDLSRLSKQLGIPVFALNSRCKLSKLELLKALNQVTGNYSNDQFNKLQTAAQRYQYLDALVRNITKHNQLTNNTMHKLDYWLTHRVWGLFIFAWVALGLFQITFTATTPITNKIEELLEWTTIIVTNWLKILNASEILISLVTTGILGGVGGVLVFIPVLVMLFFLLSLLEESGYMARVAYIMDKLMQNFGLHGRAFLPFMVSLGCNVPGIIASRTLVTRREKLLIILLSPFISCGAKLPVYVLFTGIFFQKFQGLVIVSLYLLGMLVAIFSAFLFKKIFNWQELSAFVIELPPYRVPSLSVACSQARIQAWQFIKKAGTIILAFSVITWALVNLPWGTEYASRSTILGQLGDLLSPLLSPLGLGNWQVVVALILGIVAKELIISTFTTLYGTGTFLQILQAQFNPWQAYTFLVFVLLYSPCLATLITVYQETRNWKIPLFIFAYNTSLAWFISLLIYNARFLF